MSSSSSTAARATKKSAFSCEPCRKRKVKCGGEKPTCNRCATRNDECIYKLNPTLSYTQRLEERIKELEEQLSHASRSPPSAAASTHSSPSFVGSHDSQGRAQSDELSVARGFRGLKIDDKGGVTYHGATSFFQLPNDRSAGRNDVVNSSDEQRRERLVNNAWQQRQLENLSEIPEPFSSLLHIHWCWVQPLFNFIYRPAFTRDMQTLGPYYSHTLLNAVLSHSIRWAKHDPAMKQLLDESYEGGAMFAKHARSMMFDELSRGVCTVPTAQALLLLSAQECGFGNSTQAWTYSGLAFRLIDHLGVLVDVQRYGGSVPFSDEDVEIRHRVFWSCYFWDKMISLYLGRSPSLQYSTVSPPQMMFDDSAENELWVPFGTPPHGGSWDYTPRTAYAASCFLSMCRLSVIFNHILVHMYDPLSQNTEAEMLECLQTQEVALRQWWEQLSPSLRLEPTALPSVAPPTHIVTLNCLYHTFRILLYRPMLTRGNGPDDDGLLPIHSSLIECVTSATSIIAIFDLFCRTFGSNYSILSISYAVYIAASIFLLQVQAAPDDEQALRRLDFSIQCLEQVKHLAPVIATALDLILRELSSLGISVQGSGQQAAPVSTMPAGIPATPSMYPPGADVPSQHPMTTDHQVFQAEWVNNLGPQSMAADPGLYQALSSLEPLSVRVGAMHGHGGQSAPS